MIKTSEISLMSTEHTRISLANKMHENASTVRTLFDLFQSSSITFSGVQCLERIYECGSNPCKNGGTCLDFIGRYVDLHVDKRRPLSK